MKIDRQTFDEQRSRRFGKSNPQRMRLAFWVKMAQERLWPYLYREEFGVGGGGGPIWSFQRMGQTETELADGRTICIGGDYEDFYDPDFCIYNDVVVRYPDGSVKIYGYPREVFPPTDFHTASLVGGRIVIIGCLGYSEDFHSGFTPVQSLDLWNFRIEPIPTQGDPPGWIFDHEAEVDPSGESITLRGGKLLEAGAEGCLTRLNIEEYRFHLVDRRWERITDRSCWQQFLLTPTWTDDWSQSAPPKSVADLWCHDFPENAFSPEGIAYEVVSNGQLNLGEYYVLQRYEITVEGVGILFVRGFGDGLRMIVKGSLADSVLTQVINKIQSNLEAIGGPCSVRKM